VGIGLGASSPSSTSVTTSSKPLHSYSFEVSQCSSMSEPSAILGSGDTDLAIELSRRGHFSTMSTKPPTVCKAAPFHRSSMQHQVAVRVGSSLYHPLLHRHSVHLLTLSKQVDPTTTPTLPDNPEQVSHQQMRCHPSPLTSPCRLAVALILSGLSNISEKRGICLSRRQS
jgi:hypothetical protein